MELADILGIDESIPHRSHPEQKLGELVALLPQAPSVEALDDDPAIFLTASEGLALAQDYFLTGNLAASARKMHVRYVVALRTSKEGWFMEEMVSLEHQLKIQQKARLDKILDKTLANLENRLEYGDEVMTKDGLVSVSVKARDLAAIAAILTDRREKLDDATKPAGGAPKGKLLTLADQLRDKAKAAASNATMVDPLKVGNGP